MASSEATKPTAVFGAGYLYTPEEPLADSFSKSESAGHTTNKLAPIQTLSPPVSPADSAFASFSSATRYPAQDAPLYPDHTEGDGTNSQTPLFIDDSPASSPKRRDNKSAAPPKPTLDGLLAEKTNLGTAIGSSVYIHPSREGALEYYYARLAEMDHITALQRENGLLPKPKKSAASPRDPLSAHQLARLGKPTGVTKTKPVPKATPRPKTPKADSPIKASPTSKRVTKARNLQDFEEVAFSQTSQPKHKRAAPSKKVDKEDDNSWRELPDYCPPIETLQSAPKPLKTDWKRTPLDISKEIDLDCLASAEYDVAVDLRIRPVQYLANKRRMFAAKVKSLQEGKNFTKTAAQNATNIDVNKASKMWEAFDRVGWFKESLFETYLQIE